MSEPTDLAELAFIYLNQGCKVSFLSNVKKAKSPDLLVDGINTDLQSFISSTLNEFEQPQNAVSSGNLRQKYGDD